MTRSEETTAGIVLAGGRSRRMGSDKAALDWNGEPMLAGLVRTISQRCEPVFVVATEDSAAYRLLHGTGGPDATWVTDEEPGAGPLAGLAVGLAAARDAGCELAFVSATDMPLIEPELIDELQAAVTDTAGAVVAHDAERDHPMAAIYRTDAADAIAELVAAGERRMTAALEALATYRVTVSDPLWLTNVNSPEDVHRVRISADAARAEAIG
ncbi:molybdenum cofactor guanylyltransferase [Gordonia aichiensis]|uniref:Probable molybdenum cofactor guanylyltransferase n=1 Tax=Gordonia aichiensis NBRC 108223 TaxID=1220583 RepID=L7KMN5_9ACTN|nr:molybdenum cofactor guanylyltransferase [Gordonia aichiensis]GAC49771.1 molybdopterin-guanine dinucleotide biosynthesis protein A [Gordonia aichiensis NBRC 108223]